MSRVRREILIYALVGGLLGCNKCDDATDAPGELGSGSFVYECINESDAFCDKDLTAKGFPSAFAVGGTFRLSFRPPESQQGTFSVLPASSDSISHEGLEYTLHRAGAQGVYAGALSGVVTDFRHLLGRDIDHLEIANVAAADTYEGVVELTNGKTSSFVVTPWSEKNELLAGSLSYSWTVKDETIVAVTPQGVGEHRARLVAKKAGRTHLVVEVNGHRFLLPVEVADRSGSDLPDGGTSPASQMEMDAALDDADGGMP